MRRSVYKRKNLSHKADCPECGNTIKFDATTVDIIGIEDRTTHCLNKDCSLYLTKEEVREYFVERSDMEVEKNDITVIRNY